MKRYLALLRGINVSGQKLIKMADLRKILEASGLDQVETYVQSGNVFFSTEIRDRSVLQDLIRDSIKKEYGFEVPVLVKTPVEIEAILNNNPHIQNGKDPDRNYITLLFSIPENQRIEELKKVRFEPEEYIIDKDVIFFFSPNGYGRAKMNNNYFENKLDVMATTRNWKSMNKFREILNKA